MIILDNGGTFSLWAKAIAAFLSAVIGILTIQLFERHRVIELADSIQLQAIENTLNKKYNLSYIIHDSTAKRMVVNEKGDLVNVESMIYPEKKGMFGHVESTTCWKYGLWFFTIISAFVCISSLVNIWTASPDCRFQVLQLAAALGTGALIILFSLVAKDRGTNSAKKIFGKRFVWKSSVCLGFATAMGIAEVLLLLFHVLHGS